MRIFLAAAAAACACIGSAMADVSFPVMRGKKKIPTKVVAANGAEVSKTRNGVRVDVEAKRPGVWPAAYFTFRKPLDLSSTDAIQARVRNLSKTEMLFTGLKVKATTLQGETPGTARRIQPGKTAVIRLPLKIDRYVFDKDPKMKGLKRNPKVAGAGSYAVTNSTSIAVYLPPLSEGSLIVESIELAAGSKGVDAKILKADEINPWVDEFGQAKFAEFPGKIKTAEDLKASAAREREQLLARPNAIPDADEYGGWKGGPKLEATGHFRTEKVNGKWWLVTPAGHLFFANGMNYGGWNYTPTAVQHREEYFEKLPPKEGETEQFWTLVEKVAYRNYYSDPAKVPYWAFSFQRYNLWRKYGDDYEKKDMRMCVRRMRAWGINCVTGAARNFREKAKIPYQITLSPQSRKIASVKGYWGEMIDPYAPEFEANCRKQAQWITASAKDDPYCVGCTFHNELSWERNGEALARAIHSAPPDQPARKALIDFFVKRGVTPKTATAGDWSAFGEEFACKYYSTVRAAIKEVAPDMLYLGDRNDKVNREVFMAASKYCDVITVNTYDFQASVSLPEGAEDKPLWVTEFHFGCYDTGYFYASLVPVESQTVRADCYRKYMQSALDNPSYVGCNWFCWRDQPITGITGESANSSCGIVSVTDEPYAELAEAFAETAKEMYTRRAAE